LLTDLRTDKGMDWVPGDLWLSYLQLDTAAADLDYDLAISTTAGAVPSPKDAGLDLVSDGVPVRVEHDRPWLPIGVAAGLTLVVVFLAAASRRSGSGGGRTTPTPAA
jgi:hypothetical protein